MTSSLLKAHGPHLSSMLLPRTPMINLQQKQHSFPAVSRTSWSLGWGRHTAAQLVSRGASTDNAETASSSCRTSQSAPDSDTSYIFNLTAISAFLSAVQEATAETTEDVVTAATDATTAIAVTGMKYDPSEASDFIKNSAGTAYVVLVIVFLYRVLTRRARRAKEVKLSSTEAELEAPTIFTKLREKIGNPKPARANALSAFLGAAQAGALACGMFFFTTKLTSSLDIQALPDAYTARNIAVTVRTILSGLCYLATFIFAANSLGLLGLSGQLVLFPNSLDKMDLSDDDAPKGPQLPRVSVLAKPGELSRAFDLADKMGQTPSPVAKKKAE